jgi:predicted component of type VI protein secretion system
MKIQLVVASGVHQGKAIPVPNGKITIGRDPSCQLRPASPAVSKLHCTIQVRDNKVFLTDHGSTNGTILNDTLIEGEVEVAIGSLIKVGPLDFTLQLVAGSKPDNTPVPDSLKASTGKLSEGAGTKPAAATAAKDATPMPQAAVPAPAPKPAEKPAKKSSETSTADDLAAMLLAEEDDSNPIQVPEGSTVMEMLAVDADKIKAAGADPKKKIASSQETSSAAAEILKKYRSGGR